VLDLFVMQEDEVLRRSEMGKGESVKISEREGGRGES